MRTISIEQADDFDGWRNAARRLAREGVPPNQVLWQVGDESGDLLETLADTEIPRNLIPEFPVARSFIALARSVVCHSDPERFALLYAMLWRVRDAPYLATDRTDPLLLRLSAMARDVDRDLHKMRAFLRFREIGERGTHRFVAWFEPRHHILRANAHFFVRRFAAMHWSILTPELSLHWDGATLQEGPGATRSDAPTGDPLELTWQAYYAATFNPARVKVRTMLKEMPRRYWKDMPETALVAGLIAGAQARESAMVIASRENLGANVAGSWEALREEAAGCTRCPLFKDATQTVFGAGPLDARLMFVGEQPGDQEDIAGRPFVGPAGQMFDDALDKAGIDRARVYVTNAVKHFKYERRGKRRIHSKPNAGEIQACRWWYGQERELIRPAITVALGATAARQMLGKAVTISGTRGSPHRLEDGTEGWVTVHPSFLLRMPDREAAKAEFQHFVDDLSRIRERLQMGS